MCIERLLNHWSISDGKMAAAQLESWNFWMNCPSFAWHAAVLFTEKWTAIFLIAASLIGNWQTRKRKGDAVCLYSDTL